MDGSLAQQVKDLIAQNKVMMFSKSYCPFCVRAQQLLGKSGVSFKCVEMDQIPNGDQMHEAVKAHSGQRTVPLTYVNGVKVGGCDDLMAAASNGKLKKMLDDCGVANSL